MDIERIESGFKVTVPLITEEDIRIINNDFDNITNKFVSQIITDKDLAIAQYIIKKQQEQINELKRNSIPKKKIKDKIEELRQEALEIHSILIKQTKKEYDYMLYKHYLDLIQQIKGLRKILEETNENT